MYQKQSLSKERLRHQETKLEQANYQFIILLHTLVLIGLVRFHDQSDLAHKSGKGQAGVRLVYRGGRAICLVGMLQWKDKNLGIKSVLKAPISALFEKWASILTDTAWKECFL